MSKAGQCRYCHATDSLLFASFSYIPELLSVSFILSLITLVGYTNAVEVRIENGLKQETIGITYSGISLILEILFRSIKIRIIER